MRLRADRLVGEPALFRLSDQPARRQSGRNNGSVSNQAEPCCFFFFKDPAVLEQRPRLWPEIKPTGLALVQALKLVYSVWAYSEERAALQGAPGRHLYMCNWLCVCVCVWVSEREPVCLCKQCLGWKKSLLTFKPATIV